VVFGKGSACFDIVEDGITLDGNGFKISANEPVDATAVKSSGLYANIRNLNINNFKIGIHSSGQYSKIQHNTITQTSDGINVSATHTEVSYNAIKGIATTGTSAAIYVYFPSTTPVDAFMSITNNVISNIQGTDFALGIAVYYAKAVFVAHNTISDLKGALAQEISVIGGEADIKDNVFTASVEEIASTFPVIGAVLLSCALVLASATWFFTPSTKSAAHNVVPFPEEKEESEEKRKEREQAEANGEQPKRPLSFAVGSSPRISNLKGSGRWGISSLSFSTDLFTNPLSSSSS